MTTRTDPRPREPEAGLCRTCRHARRIVSGKGSTFILCSLSTTDPRFSKYPSLPVLACPGYAPMEPEESA